MSLEPTIRSSIPRRRADSRRSGPAREPRPVSVRVGRCLAGALLVMILVASGCAGSHGKASSPSDQAGGGGTYTPPPVVEVTQWPYSEPPEVPDGWKVKKLVKEVTFAGGTATLGAEARGALREMVRETASNAKWGFLAVGFTDNRGEEPRAVKLGLARAKAVSGFLRSLGVEADRLAVMNLGSRYAKAGEFEPRKLAHDRRVEVWAFRK